MPRLSSGGALPVNRNRHRARVAGRRSERHPPARRSAMKPMAWAVLLLAGAGPLRAAELDPQRCRDTSVVQILTHDADGALRDTSVWIACFDGHGYVRTNDSRWLANIRRGSKVALRLAGEE